MALGLLGVLDLSIITDTLIGLLDDCITNSPLWNSENPAPTRFTITVNGAQPEAVRNDGNCQLSLYLFHVAQDKFQRNFPVVGQRSSEIPQQPMSLDLYYLLTAYAGKNYAQEQQAMSIAMRCFYNKPIIKKFVQGDPHQEFTLSMEVESADELGRLWQAITIPFRLSAVYKVSVVFITPDEPLPIAPHPKKIGLSVNPTSLPYASEGQVFGTSRTVDYPAPDNTSARPDIRSFHLSPAVAGAGETFLLQGAGLNSPTSHRLYLLLPDGSEHEVTNWVVPVSLPPGTPQSDAQLILKLPSTVGTPPNTPAAGVYQLRVGSDTAQGDIQTYRSNTTPFSIAAHIDGPSTTSPALLTASGGVFTLNGAGFTTGKTEVLLDTIALTAAGGAPNAGEFNVNGSETSIAFKPPGTLAPGRYTVRVRVNQVESAPGWWIDIP
jgi:hypothetical protein